MSNNPLFNTFSDKDLFCYFITFFSDEDRIRAYLSCMTFNWFIRLNKCIRPLYLDLNYNYLEKSIIVVDEIVYKYIYDNIRMFRNKFEYGKLKNLCKCPTSKCLSCTITEVCMKNLYYCTKYEGIMVDPILSDDDLPPLDEDDDTLFEEVPELEEEYNELPPLDEEVQEFLGASLYIPYSYFNTRNQPINPELFWQDTYDSSMNPSMIFPTYRSSMPPREEFPTFQPMNSYGFSYQNFPTIQVRGQGMMRRIETIPFNIMKPKKKYHNNRSHNIRSKKVVEPRKNYSINKERKKNYNYKSRGVNRGHNYH